MNEKIKTLLTIAFVCIVSSLLSGCSKDENSGNKINKINLIKNYPFVADSKTLPSDYPTSYKFHNTTIGRCIYLRYLDCDIGFNSFEEALATERKPCECCKYDFVKHTIKKELPDNIIEIQFGGFSIYHKGFGKHESKNWMYVDISYEEGVFVRKEYKINFYNGSRGGSWWGHIKWKDTDPVELDYTPPF